MRWFKKMACKVNGSLWINGCVNFNRDFTIQNPIASRFHFKTNVLKKKYLIRSYTTLKTKSIFLHPVLIHIILCIYQVTYTYCLLGSGELYIIK